MPHLSYNPSGTIALDNKFRFHLLSLPTSKFNDQLGLFLDFIDFLSLSLNYQSNRPRNFPLNRAISTSRCNTLIKPFGRCFDRLKSHREAVVHSDILDRPFFAQTRSSSCPTAFHKAASCDRQQLAESSLLKIISVKTQKPCSCASSCRSLAMQDCGDFWVT